MVNIDAISRNAGCNLGYSDILHGIDYAIFPRKTLCMGGCGFVGMDWLYFGFFLQAIPRRNVGFDQPAQMVIDRWGRLLCCSCFYYV